MFDIHYDYYTDIEKFVETISKDTYKLAFKWQKQNSYKAYNISCAFDIETSSFYSGNEKQVIMYIWQFAFNGYVVIGRTWDDFNILLNKLITTFNIDVNNRLCVYVHNLSYEFQFICKRFEWDSIFAVDSRKPIKALTVSGIEFRDSYILSGYNLAKTGEQLHTYKVKKLVGDLDYELIRTPLTPLTEKEMHYCINDVLVVSAYIQEQIEMYGNILKIPMTNTGRVRNYCRKNCYEGFDKKTKKEAKYSYKKLMSSLTLTVDEYKLLKRAFMGGFTHANALKVDKTLYNVSSFDFTSSYPYVMLSEKYPMGKGFKITHIKNMDEFNELCGHFCLVFDMKLEGITAKIISDNPLSFSKCWEYSKDLINNNGRVFSASYVITSGTELDLQTYMKFYNIEHCTLFNIYAYAKEYLPRNFLLSILKLYNDKTQLKGVQGKEVEYLHSKGMLNSCYGMTVTDIAKDEQVYNNGWTEEPVNLQDCIDKYNSSKNRFLFYPWGIYVTAYARRNLFSAIAHCNNHGYDSDYCYSDTDSVKILNREKHEQYFEDYNNLVRLKIKKCCYENNIDEKLFSPKTIQGKVKTIGVWDYEGDYNYFKTLGAKRYIYVQDNKLHVTIAGVGKKPTEQYLTEKYKNFDSIFSHFNCSLSIPETYSGKNTHTYIDDKMTGTVLDYKGVPYDYDELSGVHLEKTGFNMSRTDQFFNFLKGVRYEYRL